MHIWTMHTSRLYFLQFQYSMVFYGFVPEWIKLWNTNYLCISCFFKIFMAQIPCFKNRLHIFVVFKQIPDVEHTIEQDVGGTYWNSFARLHRFYNCICQIWQGYVMNVQAVLYSTLQGGTVYWLWHTVYLQRQTVPRQIVVLSL